MNSKLTRTFNIDKDFFDTVKYYLEPDDELRRKIKFILLKLRDHDLTYIEDSELCTTFKREVLAICLNAWRNYRRNSLRAEKYGEYRSPWSVDTAAVNCANRIRKCVAEWYNEGV